MSLRTLESESSVSTNSTTSANISNFEKKRGFVKVIQKSGIVGSDLGVFEPNNSNRVLLQDQKQYHKKNRWIHKKNKAKAKHEMQDKADLDRLVKKAIFLFLLF